MGPQEGAHRFLEKGVFAGPHQNRRQLVLYRTRGAFKNPTRDVAQLIAVGTATRDVEAFRRPMSIGRREFWCGCPVEFELTLPERDGLDAAPLMKKLSFVKKTVKKTNVWGQYVRSSPIRLPPHDLKLLCDQLRRYAGALR